MSLFKVYSEKLFYIYSKDRKNIKSKYKLEYELINENNYHIVENLRGKSYAKQFKKMLAYGDIGVYAKVDGNYVGYGWAKLSASKDYFFKIDECYLCRFFVDNDYRGAKIYPSIINWLISYINDSKNINTFFLAIEDGNESSIRGANKVGFVYYQTFNFFRILKVTLNKVSLSDIAKELY